MRGYGFDKNSNRTGQATATSTSMSTGATGDGDTTACPAVPALASTGTFDTADRIIDGSVYDAFGRATSTPATASLAGAGQASTQAYYVDDLIRSQTTGATRTTWSLDPAGRFLTATAESNAQPDGSGAWSTSTVKTNHYDSTGDSPRWITENATGTALTRYVDGIDGNLLASTTATGGTVLQLSDIHGDTVLQLPLDTAVAPTALDSDEYGNPTTTARDAGARYGWLGAKQRTVETPTGMTLMGVRVYNPTTGRFLSLDPIPGGGKNAYGYPIDPINGYDLDGRVWWRKTLRAAAIGAGIVGALACGASIVCAVGVGAAAGLAAYSARNAFSSRWRWSGAARATAIGGASGLLHGGVARRLGHTMKGWRYGVTFNRAASARGSDLYWRGRRVFGIHSHRIAGMSRWRFVHYHRRGPGGIKSHRPWQGRW